MESGVIISSLAGYFFVSVGDKLLMCRARGKLREKGVIPLAGDRVKLSAEVATESVVVTELLPRRNYLVRPAVANVDKVIVVMCPRQPKPNLLLVDKIIAMACHADMEPVVCVNKADLDMKSAESLAAVYKEAGHETVITSAVTGMGTEMLSHIIGKSTVVLAGQSGVGKSLLTTLVSRAWPDMEVQVGRVSNKGGRGRHTTRQVSLLSGLHGGRVADTPGFSMLDPDMPSDYLSHCFIEFREFMAACRFNNCSHVHEPGCAVRAAVDNGSINVSRYQNYCRLLSEIQEKEGTRY